MYKICEIKDELVIIGYGVIYEPTGYEITSGTLCNKDADLLCQTLNRELALQTRLAGILNPQCPVPTISNENVLEEAKRLIYSDRAATYGPVTVSFERIAKFWEVILETNITAEQVGLCMIALKMSRQISKAGRDNIVDIAGYAGCIAKMEEEKTAV